MSRFHRMSAPALLLAFVFCSFSAVAANIPADYNKSSRELQFDKFPDEVKVMKERYKAVLTWEKWGTWKETELDFLQFVRAEAYEREKKVKHGSEIYGEKAYVSYMKAKRFLDQLPNSDFNVGEKLWIETHRVSNGGNLDHLSAADALLPCGIVGSESGCLKKRMNFGEHPLQKPVSDKIKLALRNNYWLGTLPDDYAKVEELTRILLPRDYKLDLDGEKGNHGLILVGEQDKDQNRGFILYSTPAQARTKVAELEKLYNDWRKQAHNEEIDPIELAARMQWALVSIHPSVDGNGRTSRLIMNRILKEFGLPPSLMKDSSDDIYMTWKDWAVEVRKGVNYWLDMAEKKMKNGFPQQVPSIASQDLFRPSAADRTGWFSRGIFPDKNFSYENERKRVFRFGKNDGKKLVQKDFVLQQDGFFYDSHGIPHRAVGIKPAGADTTEYHVFPVADMTYTLYYFGGKLKENPRARQPEQAEGSNAPVVNVYVRDFSKAATDAYMTALHVTNEYFSKGGSFIKVHRHSNPGKKGFTEFGQANKEGRYYLQKDENGKVYDFEKELFFGALEFDKKEVEKPELNRYALLRTKAIQTNYENDVVHKRKITTKPGDTYGQYTKLDLLYWGLKNAAEYNFNNEANKSDYDKAMKQVTAIRSHIHTAAKKLLAPVIKVMASSDEKVILESEGLKAYPQYKMLVKLYENSYLNYESFSAAVKELGDENVALIRADNKGVKYRGYHSKKQYRKYMKMLGVYDFIKGWIKEQKAITDDPKKNAENKKKFIAFFEGKMEKKPVGEDLSKLDGEMFRAKIFNVYVDIANAVMQFLAKSNIPGLKEHLDAEKQYAAYLAYVAQFEHGMFRSQYEYRGVTNSDQRVFIDQHLQMIGSTTQKPAVSFTVSPNLLVSSNGKTLPFIEEYGAAASFVIVPRDNVRWNLYSTYSGEYEVLGVKSIWAINTRREFKPTVVLQWFPKDLWPRTEPNPRYLDDLNEQLERAKAEIVRIKAKLEDGSVDDPAEKQQLENSLKYYTEDVEYYEKDIQAHKDKIAEFKELDPKKVLTKEKVEKLKSLGFDAYY